MATLYRKYRPQSFGEVVGQKHIKMTLEYELKTEQLAHAYLFCGPRAVGKTTLARVMAKSLNCPNRAKGTAEPCNECSSCRDIAAGRSLDIIEIDAASNTGVDNVRENIIASARVAPSVLKYKIFIIDEVHMLSASAFNALLKIMEEPPEFVVFVLCTTEVHKLPSTVISRCQRFDFKKISVLDIVKKLEYILSQESIDADRQVLEAVARYSGGHMRDAESILGQILSLAERPAEGQHLALSMEQAELVIPKNDLALAVKLLEYLSAKDAASALRLAASVLDDGFDLKIFVTDIVEMLRQMMLVKVNPDLIPALGVELGESLSSSLLSLAERSSLPWILRAIEVFNKAKNSLKDQAWGQLALEVALVEIGAEAVAATATVAPVAAKAAASRPSVKTVSEPAPQPVVAAATNPVAEAAPAVVVESGDLGLIVERWVDFTNSAKQLNHSLSFVLATAKPVSLKDNVLRVSMKHKIHMDRLLEPEMRKILEGSLLEVYGQALRLEAILEADNMTAQPTDAGFDDILKNFGGKIVG